MTTSTTQPPAANQAEKTIDSLKNEITALKSQLKKNDDRIASLDVMLNQIMETHTVQARAYEDLEGMLDDVVEMLRTRTPHGIILDFFKFKDSNEFQFRKLW